MPLFVLFLDQISSSIRWRANLCHRRLTIAAIAETRLARGATSCRQRIRWRSPEEYRNEGHVLVGEPALREHLFLGNML